MKLHPKLPQIAARIGLACLLAAVLYVCYLVFKLEAKLAATADVETVSAVTLRMDKLQDQLDRKEQFTPVADADFRSSQQALSNRIDSTQALTLELKRVIETLQQDSARNQDLIVLAAKLDQVEGGLQDLKTNRAATVAKPKSASPQRKPEAVAAKPIEPPPPFNIIGIEYRGGERFLSVAPPGSSSLSDLYLVHPGDSVGATSWRLASLDGTSARFTVNGSARTVALKP